MSKFKTYLKTDLSRQIEILKDKKVNLKNYIRKEVLRKFIIYLAINAIYILVTLSFMNGFLFFIWFTGNFFFTINFSLKLFDTSERMKSFRELSKNSKNDSYFEFPKITKNVDQKVNSYILDCKKLLFKPIIELFVNNIEYFPQKFADTTAEKPVATKEPVQNVASVSRRQGGRKSVKLTKSQVVIAKKLGVPLEEYAKYVKEAE